MSDHNPTEPVDLARATTWGTYNFIHAGSHGSLWTIHDRARAEWIRENAPNVFQGMQILRWFARYAGGVLANAMLDAYLDPAAGVPEADESGEPGYLHYQVPPTTPVLYNDRDPAVVARSQEFLTPNTHYTQYDIADIDVILQEADHYFGGRRRVGILAAGIVYFLDDATVRHVFQHLYTWSAPGSILAINGWRDLPNDPGAQGVIDIYRRQGIVMYGREPDELEALLGNWQPLGAGFQNVEDLLRDVKGFDRIATDETRGKLGYGGFMVHP